MFQIVPVFLKNRIEAAVVSEGTFRLPDEIQGRFRCFQLQGISQGISEDFKVFRSFQESLRRDPKRFF